MSIFGSIMHKIFSAAEGAVMPSPKSAPPTEIPPASAGAAAQASAPAPGDAAASPAKSSDPVSGAVDVEAVLTQMAAGKGGGGNWQSSIVDLLKLLDLDSSLDARKELATEIDVHAGADGTAEQNIALHKAVMQKLAANGGKVPDSLKAA